MSNNINTKFNMRKVKTTNFKDNTAMKTIQLLKKGNKKIKYRDLSEISQYMEEKAQEKGERIKVGMRGMAPDGWKTLKAMDTDLMSEADYDDYFVNKVSNTSKFSSFDQVQLYVIKY